MSERIDQMVRAYVRIKRRTVAARFLRKGDYVERTRQLMQVVQSNWSETDKGMYTIIFRVLGTMVEDVIHIDPHTEYTVIDVELPYYTKAVEGNDVS